MKYFDTKRLEFVYLTANISKFAHIYHVNYNDKKIIAQHMIELYNNFIPISHNLDSPRREHVYVHDNKLHIKLFFAEYTIAYTFNILSELKNYPIEIIIDYSIIGIDTGLFWSIQPSFYKKLDQNKSIECFSSIFNRNLKYFYSLLPSEKKYGSQGNFFQKFLDDTSFTTYVINPPYTDTFFKLVIQLIKDKKSHPCEIFLAAPNWDDIVLLIEQQLKARQVIQHSSIFDYYNNKYIHFPIRIYHITKT